MFKYGYLQWVQARTKRGIKRSIRETMQKARDNIRKSSDRGENTIKVTYDKSLAPKVQMVAEVLNKEGFKTEITDSQYYTYLHIQW